MVFPLLRSSSSEANNDYHLSIRSYRKYPMLPRPRIRMPPEPPELLLLARAIAKRDITLAFTPVVLKIFSSNRSCSAALSMPVLSIRPKYSTKVFRKPFSVVILSVRPSRVWEKRRVRNLCFLFCFLLRANSEGESILTKVFKERHASCEESLLTFLSLSSSSLHYSPFPFLLFTRCCQCLSWPRCIS